MNSTAFLARDPVGGQTAADALTTLTGMPVRSDIVHLGLPLLQARQEVARYDAHLGSLGDALARAHIPRAVVSAADLAPGASGTELARRSSVLGLTDRWGTVDRGRFDGLLRPAAEAPFGIETDPGALRDAVRSALDEARVVLVDPGETLRADEFAVRAPAEGAELIRREALERADVLIGIVADLVDERDLLIVLAPSSPTSEATDHLTPIVLKGRGKGLLIAPTTKRAAVVTLPDVAPTVLSAVGIPRPDTMSGRPMDVRISDPASVARLAEFDRRSVFREKLAAGFLPVFGALIAALSVALMIAYAAGARRTPPGLRSLSLVLLAVPAVAAASRLFDVSVLGIWGAHALLWSSAVALAALAAAVVRGPPWGAGVALMLVTSALLAGDLTTGGRLQVNGLLGHAAVVGGRYYGTSNIPSSLLCGAGVLGLAGLADLRGHRRLPWWLLAGGLGLVLLVGLPPFGANLGGMVTVVTALAVLFLLSRRGSVGWGTAVTVAAVAALAASAAIFIDLARPVAEQTHLGRFASSLLSGEFESAMSVVRRKAESSFGSLEFTPWTYAIPIGLAVMAVILRRPRGHLGRTLTSRPLTRAAAFGVIVAGAVGFAINDSGIAMPSMILASLVPLLLLLGVFTKGARPAEPLTSPVAEVR